MVDRYTRERIENWVGDFVQGDRAREFDAATLEFAPQILATLLDSAAQIQGVDPSDVGEAGLRGALLDSVAPLELPSTARKQCVALCASFLAELEREGRVSGGRALGGYLRALQGAFDAAGGDQKPYVRPGSSLSRNDPCACGSGKKYKKCCLRLLDA